MDRINEEAYTYNTSLSYSSTDDALLTKLLTQKSRGSHDFCVRAIKDLLLLCTRDDEICEFIYNMPPPTFQYARFSDWFSEYLQGRSVELNNSNLIQYKYHQDRVSTCDKAMKLLPIFEEKCKKLAEKEEEAMKASLAANEYGDLR